MDFKLFLFLLKLIIVHAGVQHVPVTRIQNGPFQLGTTVIPSEETGKNIGYEYQYGIYDSIKGYINQVHVLNRDVILNEPSYQSIPVSSFKTLLDNKVTKVNVPSFQTEQTVPVSFSKINEKSILASTSDSETVPKITQHYKHGTGILRLPVQHISLVEDDSQSNPIFSNAPNAIISSLLTSGVSNKHPEIFSQLSELLGSNLLRTTAMEKESVTPPQLYTEALIDSPTGDKKIPITDFFSVKYYKK